MKTAIFSGSFNPIHIGHLIIADFVVENTDLDELWLVVSPQNPLKEKAGLAPDDQRLEWVRMAVEEHPKLNVSDVEFHLPRPSYTIDTLNWLKANHPERQFVLVVGGDNLAVFHRWKAYEEILDRFEVLVYQRPGYDAGPLAQHPAVRVLDAPLLEISATMIRRYIKEGKSYRYMVPGPVYESLSAGNFYEDANAV